ncbi:MAG: hypothetical protein LBT61_03340 [Prevotellaceae bacterium]|jgi:hypothetical protein|nr:hypothetical protein [Prevotellaceae bacterium]
MNAKKIIPSNDRSFLTWLLNLLNYIAAGGLSRFRIPDEPYNKVSAEAADFEAKLKVADEPDTRTKASVQAKTTARKLVEKDVRQFVKEFLASNSLVTDADRDNMGIPIHSTTRHPAQVAGLPPYITVSVDGPRRLRFDFGEASSSKVKPAGQHGVEIAWVVSDEMPASYSGLIRSSFDTHTPLILSFDLPDAGKRIWFAARWENTRGEKGPWTEIMSAIIP